MKVYVGYWNHRHGKSKPIAAFSSEGKMEEWRLAKRRQLGVHATNPSAPIPEWVELTIDDVQDVVD